MQNLINVDMGKKRGGDTLWIAKRAYMYQKLHQPSLTSLLLRCLLSPSSVWAWAWADGERGCGGSSVVRER